MLGCIMRKICLFALNCLQNMSNNKVRALMGNKSSTSSTSFLFKLSPKVIAQQLNCVVIHRVSKIK